MGVALYLTVFIGLCQSTGVRHIEAITTARLDDIFQIAVVNEGKDFEQMKLNTKGRYALKKGALLKD